MRTCPLCQASLGDDAVFCPKCGARVGGDPAAVPAPPEFPELGATTQAGAPGEASVQDSSTPGPDYQGRKIKLCSDGKYRWLYEYDMFKNPVVLLTVVKIIAISIAGLLVLMSIFPAIRGDWDSLLFNLKLMGIVAGIFAVLIIASYLLLAASFRGRYLVLFEMDDEGVVFRHLKKQYDKAKGWGLVTAFVGAATGSFTAAGAGILAATKDTQVSYFPNVRSVRVIRPFYTIKVNEPFSKNQVYVPKEDFDFVVDYILSRCPRVRK